MMAGPKVTVIGAGSYFFGREVIHKMATSSIMGGGTLALVDIDEDVLNTMEELARRVFAETGCKVEVMASTDRREVMEDSDFVVLTFSKDNAYYRGLDTEIAAEHGIRMCSSDTIGPGGAFRALREIPKALDMARDTRELAPEAWLINFVNPTTVLGMALRRYVPEVKSFALCDSLHEPYNTLNWCKKAGILPEDADRVPPRVLNKLDLAIGGVNHCTWMIRFNYGSEDMMPVLLAELQKRADREQENPSEGAKARFNANYALQLYDIYGALPVVTSHTKEYVPFFQGYGQRDIQPEPLSLFDADNRAAQMEAAWQRTEAFSEGKIEVETFLKEVSDDHATDIIESMWGDLGKQFYINTANNQAVKNLADDAFLELRCDVDMQGPRPQPLGRFERGLLALQQQILDTHELTAEAAVTGDKSLLKRALLTDPLGNNIADVEACIEDLLKAEKKALPDYWY